MRNFRVFIQHPQLFFYVVAATMLFCGLVNFHSSISVKDYIETSGEIRNVESEQVLWHQQHVTRYQYDIVWYADGEQHVKHLDGQVKREEEGPVTVWMRPDKRDAILGNSVTIKENVPLFIGIGLLFGVIGLVVGKVQKSKRRETRAQRIERLEDTKMYCVIMIVLAVISLGLYGTVFYSEWKEGYISALSWDMMGALVLAIAVAFGVFFRAKKQLQSGR